MQFCTYLSVSVEYFRLKNDHLALLQWNYTAPMSSVFISRLNRSLRIQLESKMSLNPLFERLSLSYLKKMLTLMKKLTILTSEI